MVAHGNRWLEISEDSEETIIAYQYWADLSTSQRFLYQSQDQVTVITDQEEFKQAAINLLALAEFTADKFPNEIYISNGYKEAVSDISVVAIKNTLNSEEVLFWVTGLKTQNSILDYLNYVNNQVLSQQEQMSTGFWLQSLLKLGNESLNGSNEISESTYTFFNDVLIETFISLVEKDIETAASNSDQVLALLSYSKLVALVERWVNPINETPTETFEEHYAISISMYDVLIEKGLSREATILGRYISTKLSTPLAVSKGYEGTYEFYDDRNQKWTFTFLKDSYNRMIAAVANEQRSILINYYYVQYDFENKTFVGSQYESDDSPYPSNTITFSFNDEDGSASIFMPYVGMYSTAQKTQSYPDVYSKKDDNSVPIEGSYEGVIHLPSGTSIEVTLSIVPFIDSVMARLKTKNGYIQIDFKNTTDGRDGVLYMTGIGGTGNGSWMHLRLIQDEETYNLSGHVVVGGWGMSDEESHFVKSE